MNTYKKVFLTIDDSPSSTFIEKLDYLESKNIPAVFFCIGNLMEKREEMMVECVNRGFSIGNHSYSHPHFSKIDIDQCKIEIEKTDEIIEILSVISLFGFLNRWNASLQTHLEEKPAHFYHQLKNKNA